MTEALALVLAVVLVALVGRVLEWIVAANDPR